MAAKHGANIKRRRCSRFILLRSVVRLLSRSDMGISNVLFWTSLAVGISDVGDMARHRRWSKCWRAAQRSEPHFWSMRLNGVSASA